MRTIYVTCPANLQTGGTELAHQFVDYLNANNYNCYIVYYEGNSFIDSPVPNGFKKYNIKSTIEIDDNEHNCLFIPEACIYFSKKFNRINFVFWWMSFDNFFFNSSLSDYVKYYLKGYFSFRQLMMKFFKHKPELAIGFNAIKRINENRVLHVYQSKYVSDMLHRIGFNNQLPLSDYINTDFVDNFKRGDGKKIYRENVVLYNPTKGFEVTKKIMNVMPSIKFVELKNLTREELNSLFRTSKVYIDFGNHPGKDRIPREACMNGCSIIIGKNGSARYFEDIPISSKYKFDDNEIKNIKDCIFNIFENFEVISNDFNFYRNKIAKEKDIFYCEIGQIMEYFNFN